MRLTQQVDSDWGNCTEHLDDIMENAAVMKVFPRDYSILCVGPDMIPQDTKKSVCWILFLVHLTRLTPFLATWSRKQSERSQEHAPAHHPLHGSDTC